MSDVSFIRAAPPQSVLEPRRNAEAPKPPGSDSKERSERRAAPAPLANKTKVQTQQVAKFQFAYTFIDAETSRVVGRYPAEPFVTSNNDAGTIV